MLIVDSCYSTSPKARTSSSTLQLKAGKAFQNLPDKKPFLAHLKMQPFEFYLISVINDMNIDAVLKFQ